MPNAKDVYKAKIYYRGTDGPYKTRPVLVLNDNGYMCTIAEITTDEPDDPPTYYDQFKEEIVDWKLAKLKRKSYVKCKNVHNVVGLELNQQIGVMTDKDFEKIVDRIAEVNN